MSCSSLSGDEIVAATIHLDHLNKTEVLKILKVLEPYDDNMKVLTKKELGFNGGLGSLGGDPAQVGLDTFEEMKARTLREPPALFMLVGVTM